MKLNTLRLTLRTWRSLDKASFAEMSSDPEVMADLGGPYDRARSDAKFDKYLSAYERLGFSRWVVEDLENWFVGYAGVMPHRPVILWVPMLKLDGVLSARHGVEVMLQKPQGLRWAMLLSGMDLRKFFHTPPPTTSDHKPS